MATNKEAEKGPQMNSYKDAILAIHIRVDLGFFALIRVH
jgi:hypothetical protein